MCSRSFKDHFSLFPHVFLTSDTTKYVCFPFLSHSPHALQSHLVGISPPEFSTRRLLIVNAISLLIRDTVLLDIRVQFSLHCCRSSHSKFSVPQVGLKAFTIKDLEKSSHSSSPLHFSSLHSLHSSSLSIPPRAIPPR